MSEEEVEQPIDYFFEPKESTNVLINVNNINTIRMLHVHADILKMASTVFTEMLTSSSSSKQLEFKETDPEAFIQFLEMLYPRKYDFKYFECESDNNITNTRIEAVLKLAEKYKVQSVKHKINKFMSTPKFFQHINYDNGREATFKALVLAEDHNLEFARNTLLNYFKYESDTYYARRWSQLKDETKLDVICCVNRAYEKLLSSKRKDEKKSEEDKDEEIKEIRDEFSSYVHQVSSGSY